MRAILIPVVVATMLFANQKTASAGQDVFLIFLNQLEKKLDYMSSDGFSGREIDELEQIIRTRPEGNYANAFRPFVDLIFKMVKRFHSDGFSGLDSRAIEILLEANPNPKGEPISAEVHEFFFNYFASMVKNLNSDGISGLNVEVIKKVAQVSPTCKLLPQVYDKVHSNWNSLFQVVEKELKADGFSGLDREIMSLILGFKPQLLEHRPVLNPILTYDRDDDHSISPPRIVKACGRAYSVSWHTKHSRRRNEKSNSLFLLRRTDDLLELDEKSCRERWIADDVIRVVPVYGTEDYVVLRENGLALLVDSSGDVYRLKRNIASGHPGKHKHVTLEHRHGHKFDVEIIGPADNLGFPISINNRQRTIQRLYRTVWRAGKPRVTKPEVRVQGR